MNRLIGRYAMPILDLSRFTKRIIVLFIDTILCVFTTWLAFYLRLGEWITFSDLHSFFGEGMMKATAASIGIALPIFVVLGLYRAIFRYSGGPAVMTIAKAIGIYAAVYAGLFTIIGFAGVPRTVGIIQPILFFLFVGGSRLFARVWLGDQYHVILNSAKRSKVLIYGAGRSGQQLANAFAHSRDMQIVGFIDDDHRLQGNILNNLQVYSPNDLANLVSSLNIHCVLLAMPSLNRNRRNEILNQIQQYDVLIRTIPSMTDLVQGKVTTTDIRELDIDDLLGRESVAPDANLLSANITNKIVLVTGAGGSIGSELCRQILLIGPSILLLVEQSEAALYLIHQELEKKLGESSTKLLPLIASVQNYNRVAEIFSTWQPDTIYHAAAYKHVPLVEHNIIEGIQNNVWGTSVTAKLAIEYQVSNFVLISTDKAVRPTNLMGASKRLAEMIIQALSETSSTTKFSIVRFGNVLDSSGSVVPKFRQQILEGGPLTLTHPEMTRYFMTIPEAAELVIQAGAMSDQGALFVLDMGDPVKISDLATRMIRLSGLKLKNNENPEGDIEILITGLRPGEKLFEELLIENNAKSTAHTRIMKAHEDFIKWNILEMQLKILEDAINIRDHALVRSLLNRLVKFYSPSEGIVDWVYLQKGNDTN
jgi:FlaA1/EpsC-like NDP-sugar epimerase